MKADLAVIILTFNESLHLARCLKSVGGIASAVFVVDSGSTDETVAIARDYGATVLTNPFVSHAEQFQWALDNIRTDASWIMRLDADEIIEADLSREIVEKLPLLPEEVSGINLDRKHIFMGSWIRYGGRYPVRLLRIWRNGCGRVEKRWMDEHIFVSRGRTVVFKGGFADHNLHDLNFFTNKHNNYATREAVEVLAARLGLFGRDNLVTRERSSMQASLKRLVKLKIYNQLPFTMSALLYFIFRYFVQFGFLDGRSGLVYHFLQGYWYRFLVGAKVMEFERAIAHLSDRGEICQELSRMTGLRISAES